MPVADDQHPAVTTLRRTVAFFALALMASTWVLWTPQNLYPEVPLLRLAGTLPEFVDWLCFGAMLASMAIVLIAGRVSRWWQYACAAYVASFGLTVLIDQHRLQPWAYQFALIAGILALVPDRRGLLLVKVLTIGIYMHSGLSKLDFSFFESHGQYLVGGLTKLVGIELEKWNPTQLRYLAAALPIGELLTAVGLCIPWTRRIALFVSILMHALLIAALGPWSLDHELGVLIWNGYFIVQNVLLFGRTTPREKSADAVPRKGPFWRIAAASLVAGFAVLLPFLEPFEKFDPWPSWAVYASRPARVRILVDREAKERLPESVARFVQEPRFSDGLCPLRIDRWSLDATHAPVYPHARFEFGVALAVGYQFQLDQEIHVEFEAAANRWNGKRTVQKLNGLSAIENAAASFVLNAFPRKP